MNLCNPVAASPARRMIFVRRAVVLLLAAPLFACTPQSPPSVQLALDGPPLPIVGDFGGEPVHGIMDRACLAGLGAIELTLPAKANEAPICRGVMDHPANEKGRMYAELACSDDTHVALVLRNLGPDQGMAVGKHDATKTRVVLFYHPSPDEARRRLVRVQADLAAADKKLAVRQQAEAAGQME